MTAVAVALPFAIHGLVLLAHGDWAVRRRLIAFCLLVLALSSLIFLWQYAVTGDPALNPYTLWWEYDKIGFGPGTGRHGGHTLNQAYINTRFSLKVGAWDFFGWGPLTWGILLVGLIPVVRRWRAWPVVATFPSLVITYMAYWVGSHLFGPRYYYEGLPGLAILAAAGFAFLAGWPTNPETPWRTYSGWRKAQPLLLTALLAGVISMNLLYYAPLRVGAMYNLYEVNQALLEPFTTEAAQELAPALVVVHTERLWTEYATLLELSNPFLNTPFIFVISRGDAVDASFKADFPQRQLIYYYIDEPYAFYKSPRPAK
jgi:hypothetical protein